MELAVSTFNSVSGIELGFQACTVNILTLSHHIGSPFYFKIMFCAFSGLLDLSHFTLSFSEILLLSE